MQPGGTSGKTAAPFATTSASVSAWRAKRTARYSDCCRGKYLCRFATRSAWLQASSAPCPKNTIHLGSSELAPEWRETARKLDFYMFSYIYAKIGE